MIIAQHDKTTSKNQTTVAIISIIATTSKIIPIEKTMRELTTKW
jgi:hypothetical protein